MQMNGTDDVSANVEAIMSRLENLRDIDVLCLPENCLYLRVDRKLTKPSGLTLEEDFWPRFREWAKKTKTHILFGSVPLRGETKLKNSTVYVSALGEMKEVYQKIHLFDVDVEGAPPSRESDNYEHGATPAVLDIDGWKWGLSICYD